MRYYGNEACTECKITKMMLDKYGIPVEFIDVATISGFNGEIPQLELDNGALLIGPQAIQSWIRQNITMQGDTI